MDVAEVAATYRQVTAAMERAAAEMGRDPDDEAYEVDDLVVREPLEQVQQKLDELVLRWQELDREHAAVRKRKLHQAGASFVNVPEEFDPLNPPDADPNTYEGKLAQIMREVPRIRQLKQQLEEASLSMMKLKREIDAAPDAASKLGQFAREINYIGLADERNSANVPPAMLAASGEDVVLSIAVCSPSKPNERTQEIEFLGSHSLLEIGRRIACVRRHFDESDAESGWLLVEGQFYAAGAQAIADAEEVRRRWTENIETASSSLGSDVEQPTAVHSMESTTFEQVSMRLGVRYVYVHSRNCQHYLYLMEVRNVHTDVDTRPLPRVVFQTKIRKRKCDICQLWSARYTIVDDKLADRTPSFQCEHCYHMLHYSARGELLYDDFEVYPYVHDMV